MLPENFPSSMSSRNSNNPNGLRPRQQQHRRQNSTPTAFRPANIQKLPNTNRQNAGHGHRRGLSLDVRQLQVQAQAQAAGQDFMVSKHTNNTGLAKYSQHLLREAQQQRIQARPGSQNPYISLAPSGSDQNLISPLTTPQLQTDQFDQSCFGANTFSFAAYGGGDVNMQQMMQRAQAVYGDQIAGGRDFDLQGLNTDSALSTPTYASFQESPTAQGWTSEGDTTSTRRSSRRISNGIMDRVTKFEGLGFDGLERPITPPNQNASNYFPPTPLETPQTRLVKIEPRPSRFVEGYDESMEETIKPTRARANRRAQNIFQDIRQQNEEPQITILPETQNFNGMPSGTPDYMSLTQFNQELMKLENGVSDAPSGLNRDFKFSHRATSSFDSTMSGMTNFDSAFDEEYDGTDLESTTSQQFNSGTHTPSGNMSPHRRGHSHRRNQSEASIVSNASIASLNIDSTRQSTGVTPQDIDQYIQMPLGNQDGDKDGPATENAHKYKCLYPGCKNIYYGRKENIKSHIQTHLNDRQYKCPNCPKCFVRQHDLKRHAKIHTGVKPYHCDCGNGFARHDALTRHRQRGMCIGALENLPERKKNKRGRPRKNRAGESTGTSSPEGPSDSSAAATPVLATTPAFDFNNPDHVMERNANILMMNMPIQSTAPMTAAPASPMFMPAQSSPIMPVQSYVSPEEIMSSHPTTPRDAHQATSPPDLVHSTSPALSGFDLDNGATMSGLPSDSMDNMNLTMPVNVDNPDEALMYAFIDDYSVHEQYVDNTPKFNDGGVDDILSDNPFY